MQEIKNNAIIIHTIEDWWLRCNQRDSSKGGWGQMYTAQWGEFSALKVLSHQLTHKLARPQKTGINTTRFVFTELEKRENPRFLYPSI